MIYIHEFIHAEAFRDGGCKDIKQKLFVTYADCSEVTRERYNYIFLANMINDIVSYLIFPVLFLIYVNVSIISDRKRKIKGLQ